MRPGTALATATLLAALLAGCSGGGATDAGTDETDFSDVDVQVSDTTGVLRGIVVDERIVPIVGASLQVTGPGVNQTTATDDLGRFLLDQLPAGTYFVQAESPLHKTVQASATVVAGDPEPPLVKLQMERLYTADPFTQTFQHDGFFECSQAGASVFFSSSNCVSDVTRSSRWPGPNGMLPQLNNVTSQDRQWQSAVDAGWQTLVWEIDWTPTSQGTSQKLGITVSTDFATRNTAFFYASYAANDPLLLRLNLGEEHPTSQSPDDTPPLLPPEGRPDVSYFVSVREPDGSVCAVLCAPPGLAINQGFKVYYTQFYYLPAPEGWSLVAGSEKPF